MSLLMLFFLSLLSTITESFRGAQGIRTAAGVACEDPDAAVNDSEASGGTPSGRQMSVVLESPTKHDGIMFPNFRGLVKLRRVISFHVMQSE